MKYIYLVIISTIIIGCSNKKEFDATGTFEATEILISSEANGKILDFNIEEGDIVKKGEELGCIDTMQLYLKKLQLVKSSLAVMVSLPSVNTQIAAIKEQINTQKREKLRVESLLKSDAASKKQLDDINSAIAVLESQLSAQKSTLDKNYKSLNEQSSAIDIQVAQIEDQLLKCKILAPTDGTILNKYAQVGELAVVAKPLFKMADLSQMFLRAYISSDQLSKIKLGDQVKISAQFGKKTNRDYSGRISWISAQSEFTPKNIQTIDDRGDMVYAIKILVKNDGFIKIGTYAEVLFNN